MVVAEVQMRRERKMFANDLNRRARLRDLDKWNRVTY